ncbi:MAG TPA: type II secretion system F family protein [Patescibacteria group bacterium]|jgi:type IV pilus assembly protein PilC
MADYIYKARDATGQPKSGEISAATEEAAAEMLAEHRLILTKLEVKREKAFDVTEVLNKLSRVGFKDRVIFTRQLGTMIKSGLPIVQALNILAEQTSNKKFQKVIGEISAGIEGGSSFSSMLAKYPKLFDRVYINMTKAGEASGQLDVTLDRLATQQEKSYGIIKKVRGAMLYPAFVLVALIGATVLMLLIVIPPLKTIFEGAGADLPFATQVLIKLSDALQSFWYLFILGAVVLVLGGRQLLQTEGGQDALDRFKLRVPIFGPLFKKIYIARFTRTLSSLVSGGVPILQALDIVGESIGSRTYERALKKAAKEVEGGVQLSQPIRGNPNFPPLVSQMISVGEQTGKMDEVLSKLASFYEEEVDNLVKNLTTLMEPLLMVVMGAAVGGLLIAILMPIYNLGSVIK